MCGRSPENRITAWFNLPLPPRPPPLKKHTNEPNQPTLSFSLLRHRHPQHHLQDFLAECAKAKRVVDHTAFLIVAGPSATAAAPKSSEASTTTINSTSVFPTGQTSTVTSPPSSKTTDVETVGEAADGFVVDGGADVSGVGGQDVALEDIHPPRKKKRRRELVVQKPGALSEGELREGRRNCSAREGSETSNKKRSRRKNKGRS